ncbi:unnamed protein product [Calypogeia fissa]
MGVEEATAGASTGITVLSYLRGLDWSSWAGHNSVLPVVAAVAAVLFVLLRSFGIKKKLKLPPGPRNWPIIGALLEMDPVLHIGFERFAARYGPVVYFRLGLQEVVLVSSAEAAEELVKTKDVDFADRTIPMNKFLRKYTGLDGALMAFRDNDAGFKLSRKVAATELFTGTKLKAFEERRGREMAVMVEKILSQIEGNTKATGGEQDYAVIPVRKTVTAMITNLVFMTLIGTRYDDLPANHAYKEFNELLIEQISFVMKFNLLDFLPFLEWLDPQGMLKELKDFDRRQQRFLGRILDGRRQAMKLNKGKFDDNQRTSSNFVDTLLSLQDGTPDSLDDQGVAGLVLAVLMAAIHTTTAQIEWVLLLLAKHPHELKKLQAEIDEVFGKDQLPTDDDIQNMPFLKACVNETLRLHPIANTTFPHTNLSPATLAGYDIPPHTAVILNVIHISRDPQAWKDPLAFRPDRFMEGTPDPDPALMSKPLTPAGGNFNFLPFGSGRRKCPGYSLAMVMLLRITATFVHAFDLKPPKGISAQELSDEGGAAHVHEPKTPLLLTCRPRLSPESFHHLYNI